jgi:hypothetical protein
VTAEARAHLAELAAHKFCECENWLCDETATLYGERTAAIPALLAEVERLENVEIGLGTIVKMQSARIRELEDALRVGHEDQHTPLRTDCDVCVLLLGAAPPSRGGR